MKYKVTLELYNKKEACGHYAREMVTSDYTNAYCRFLVFSNHLDSLMESLEKCESKSYMEDLTAIVGLHNVIEDEWGGFVHIGAPIFEETLSYKEYKAAK